MTQVDSVTTIQSANQIIAEFFLMLGNVGRPTLQLMPVLQGKPDTQRSFGMLAIQ